MKNSIVGIDIGGSKIRAVLWNGKKALKAREANTPKTLSGFKKALRDLAGNALQVGIAVPGRAKGVIFVSATNLPYIRNFGFARFFADAKIKVDHDARCFARAHRNLPAGKAGLTHLGRQAVLFLTLGTGVGRAIGKSGKVLKIKKFEYPARWEKEYKKIRDSQNDAALAKFLAKKLNRLVAAYGVRQVVIGGGVTTKRNFAAKLQKELGILVQKSKFGENAVAIGAALQF